MPWVHPTTEVGATAQTQAECDCPHPNFCAREGCKHEVRPDRRIGNWMQTAGGTAFWPLDPRPEEVHIEDIAHALGNMCRYAGHCTRFYSVAQHSVIVSHHVPPEDALWGLLHDGAEAYVVDVPRPVKPYLGNYKQIENGVMAAICERFGLPSAMPDSVKRVDNAVLVDEMEQLMVTPPRSWELPEPRLGIEIADMSPAAAKGAFLARFDQLINAL